MTDPAENPRFALERPPHELVDWGDLGEDRPEARRFEQLTAITLAIGSDNAAMHKDTHNQTIENHIKFALLVADRTSTLEHHLETTCEGLAGADQPKAREAQLVWAPAAEIIGRYDLKRRLENESFKLLEPDKYRAILEAYRELGSDEALHQAADSYRYEIAELLTETDPGLRARAVIESRRKDYYSIWRKAERKRLETGREFDYVLPDFIGIRIMIDPESPSDGTEDCYAVLGLLHSQYEPVEGRTKDYIDRPKPNGYRSLHTTLIGPDDFPVEVQIRTTEMHVQAKSDPDVSHLQYAAHSKLTPGTYERSDGTKSKSQYAWRDAAARRILENPEAGLAEGIPEGVFCFVPDGNLFQLPVSATVLDAAFAIHDRRALRTEEIKINGKQSRFDTLVPNGATLDISYARNSHWSEGWRDLVTTKKARKALERADLEANAERYISTAVETITNALEVFGVSEPLTALDEHDRQAICRRYSTDSFEIALRQIGAGKQKHFKLTKYILRKQSEDVPKPEPGKTSPAEAQPVIPELSGVIVALAECCRPKPGQPIVAQASQRGGVARAHSQDCENIHPDRAVPCEWR